MFSRNFGTIILIIEKAWSKSVHNLAFYSERQKLDFCSESILNIL